MTGADASTAAALFDPTRLRLAREAAMLLKKELAERVGVSPAAVSQYENGTSVPRASVIASLALALGVPADYFAADRPLGNAPLTTAHFRSLRATTQAERARAFAHAVMTWELARVLERHVRMPTVDLPVNLAVRVDDGVPPAVQAARNARRHLGIASGPVPHVVRLLEAHGVVTTRLPTQTRRVFSFSCGFPARPVIVLAAERDHKAAGRFDAAHELGHLVMHDDAEPGSHAIERQAHAFAAEFLAPTDEIVAVLPRRADWSALMELKQVWGISMQALLYRARELGVMSEHQYRRAVTELNTRGWRRHEPGDDVPGERPVLLSKAFDALTRAGIDMDRLSRETRLHPARTAEILGLDDRPSIKL